MYTQIFQLLLLITISNSAPVLARLLFKDRFVLPVDCNWKLPDKRPVFGTSKTWRGLLSAVVCTTIVAWLIGRSPLVGMLVAIYAMLGDLLSSFIKRRLGRVPSSKATLLDQIPESILPAIAMKGSFQLNIYSIVLVTVLFTVLEIYSARIFYKWGIRKRPY